MESRHSTNRLKTTPLHDTHVQLGARMINFAGWHMPVQYESIIKEHECVRSHAGVFDISHMGEFELKGDHVVDLLQYLMTNDLRLIDVNKSQYSCMCNEHGGVVDDNIYYMESSKKFRIIVNASNRVKDFNWITSHAEKFNVKTCDVSQEFSRLAFQGPKSDELLQPLVDVELSKLQRFQFAKCYLESMPIFLARTGYTGERGFEISISSRLVQKAWDLLLETGARPIGLGARDTLRLEACYSLYGHEISEDITPIEANIGWVVKEKEGNDYIGKEVLLRQKSEGTSRIIVGLTLLDRGILREHYKVHENGTEIGYVTSGGYSPTLKKSIGLALIKTEYSKTGTELKVSIRDKLLRARVVPTPFYRNV